MAPGPDIAWSPKTLVDSAIVDVDQDGSLDRVELYANVERDRRERLMFDDGQRWALIVRAGPHLYQLFEGFIQLGRLDFWVVASTDASPAILPLQQTPNGVLVQKYVFDRQRKAFVSTGAVDAVGTVVHQPVPR